MAKPYKKPDLKAPRNRPKSIDFLAYPDKDIHGFFARIKQLYPQLAKYSNKDIAGWIEEYNRDMAQQVATSRYGVKLPEGLGFIITSACRLTDRTAGNNIDFATSNKLGVIVHHTNIHSDNLVATIKYTNNIPRCRFENHQEWIFKPCRKLQRQVAAEFKKGNYKKFVVFSQTFHVYNLHRKTIVRKQSTLTDEQRLLDSLKGYDEFAFT